jgi:rRNA small subunit pseudouridine methyltransferase Nep1
LSERRFFMKGLLGEAEESFDSGSRYLLDESAGGRSGHREFAAWLLMQINKLPCTVRVYTLILVEAALERIPEALWKHPSVVRYAERRGKPPGELLLDVSYHYAAMRGLREREKRGRPDIVHFSLLEALGSPLARRGLLEVFVHSREGLSIHPSAGTRLPRNYERFLGLMEQALKVGRAPRIGDPLITVEEESLEVLLGRLDGEKSFLLRDGAPHVPLMRLGKIMHDAGDSLILVGAFPHGDFNEETLNAIDAEASIYGEPLEAWTVVSRMLGVLEDLQGIYA